MTTHPDKAFILAAGFGTRMKPLTNHRPKPLVEIAGKPLLDHTLAHLKNAGIKEVIINAHYLPDQMTSWANSRTTSDTKIIPITEQKILDTGGGIKNALHHFNNEPFFVIAGDTFWENPPNGQTLINLANTWSPDTMDILMVLEKIDTMTLTKGIGDYDLDTNNHATRSETQDGAYMFTNIRINHPRIFNNAPNTPFSFLTLMDKAQSKSRLHGQIHQGHWHHISTPTDLEQLNKHVQSS